MALVIFIRYTNHMQSVLFCSDTCVFSPS